MTLTKNNDWLYTNAAIAKKHVKITSSTIIIVARSEVQTVLKEYCGDFLP